MRGFALGTRDRGSVRAADEDLPADGPGAVGAVFAGVVMV